MRLQVQATDLSSAVDMAGAVVRKSLVPVLECLEISASDNQISLCGSNGEAQAQAIREAAVAEDGRVCVNYFDMKHIASRLRGVVRIELEPSGLFITSDQSSLAIPTLGDAFPHINGETGMSEVAGGVEAFQKCAPFTSTELARDHLRGVCFSEHGAVATSSTMIYSSRSALGGGQIVPIEAGPAISKIGGRLFLGQRTWRIEAEGAKATGRLIDGTFPNWSQIALARAHRFSTCDADELHAAVAVAGLGRASYVFIRACSEGLELSGDRFTGMHADTRVTVEAESGNAAVVLAAADLAKCLEPFKGRKIHLSHCGPGVSITSDDGSDIALTTLVRDVRNSLPEAA